MPIYLYVKTHNKTGLKYLGKTVSKDPHKYPGSGIRWKRHLKKHGNDVSTEILLITEDKEELKQTGLFFSELWNVVESDKWANFIPESGDGIDSETSQQIQTKRVKDGTHNLLGGETSRKVNKKRVENGTHHWLSGEHQRKAANKRVKDGTHNLLSGEIQRNAAYNKMVSNTHPMIGGIPCVDIAGKFHKVPRERYFNQDNHNRDFFHVNSKEAKKIKLSSAL